MDFLPTMIPLKSISHLLRCFIILTISAAVTATSSDDVVALKAFKSAVKPSSIPPTSCLATWNFSTDPCSVPRITHFTCGITCSGNRVIQLTLDSQGYAGTLTPLLYKLTELITLDLGDNGFYGTIPNSFPNLRNLILRVNFFSGAIPPSIAKLTSLQTLDISRNYLTGSLPKLDSLTSLTRLDISYNNLTGFLPKLPPNLNELALKSNSFSGPLLESSFNSLSNLMVLELSNNLFSGMLESWLFLLPSLQQVNLSNNSFTAMTVIKPHSSDLVAIDLSFNKIEGTLSPNFAEFPILRSLVLSHNRLRGPISSEYSRKGPLRRLFLDGNYLNGSPPAGFFSGNKNHVSGSLADNCLQKCPVSSKLCLQSQKPARVCQQAYGGGKPKS